MKSLTQKDRVRTTSFVIHLEDTHLTRAQQPQTEGHNIATKVAYVCLKQNFVLRSKNNNDGYLQTSIVKNTKSMRFTKT